MISFDEALGEGRHLRRGAARPWPATTPPRTPTSPGCSTEARARARRAGPRRPLPRARAAPDRGAGPHGGAGIAVDRAVLAALSDELGGRHRGAERRCCELAGGEFIIGSVQAAARGAVREAGLPVVKKTKTGPSTDESVLPGARAAPPAAAGDPRLPRAASSSRTPTSTRCRSWSTRATGRIHTHFSQTTAATGRLASTDPNLQNIPVRTDGRAAHPPGLRGAARPGLPVGRLLPGRAAHPRPPVRRQRRLRPTPSPPAPTSTPRPPPACSTSPPEDGRPAQMRTIAKAVNFGIVYGQSAFGLAQTAADLARRGGRVHPPLPSSASPRSTRSASGPSAAAREQGYVETLLGRRRPVPDLTSGNFAARSQAERVAINTPVQGTAADLIKKAMIAVDRRLARQSCPGQSHAPPGPRRAAARGGRRPRRGGCRRDGREEMAGAIDLKYPLVVDVGVRPDLGRGALRSGQRSAERPAGFGADWVAEGAYSP